MKKILLIVTVFVFAISCDNENSLVDSIIGENQQNYIESFNQWNNLKKNNGNSYTYKTTLQSWTGYGSTTELRIEEGVIVSRNFQEFMWNSSTEQNEIIETYSENAENLETNEKGAIPRTIDELYESCAKKYLKVNKRKNTIFFETSENGLMKFCGFTPYGCVDDCSRGVRISSFEWIDL